MKNSKKNVNSAGQNTTDVRKSQKHDANLQKNSTLYFQIGLILCLLATYSLFEMQFQDKKIVVETAEPNDSETIEVATVFRLEPEKREKPKPKKPRSKVLKDKYDVKDDDNIDQLEDEIFPADDLPTDDPVDVGNIPDDLGEEDKGPIIIPFTAVEKVPVYPGCERKKTNSAKRKCMSDKINRLVNRKFNTEIARDNGITGKRKIQTQFTVDKDGNISDIKIRAPHQALEKEARRVIGKIPQMIPGFQRDLPVSVSYNLNINFLIEN
ncbi:energy transducer TonB [Winogradskyella tangerina]|uniref:energy transducer TonB n=1 Tax=Winogradskyella tangerina TaxID=2023240 RepID=UPI000DBE02E4|nr:energy transducer TonB [Winogradskyella tangerina]